MVYAYRMIRTQIYLPLNQLQLLKQTALEERTSVSEVIRRKLASPGTKVKRFAKPKKSVGESLLGLATLFEKKGVKGPKDLSKNMDKYLYGAI